MLAPSTSIANAVNTTNTGVDVVLDYNKRIGRNKLKITLAGNIQNVTINKINIPAVLNGSLPINRPSSAQGNSTS